MPARRDVPFKARPVVKPKASPVPVKAAPPAKAHRPPGEPPAAKRPGTVRFAGVRVLPGCTRRMLAKDVVVAVAAEKIEDVDDDDDSWGIWSSADLLPKRV